MTTKPKVQLCGECKAKLNAYRKWRFENDDDYRTKVMESNRRSQLKRKANMEAMRKEEAEDKAEIDNTQP